MKTRIRGQRIQLALIILSGLLVAATAIVPLSMEYLPKPPPAEVSVIIRDMDNSLWSSARLGMEQAANDRGADLRFLSLSDHSSVSQQQELILREIERGCDGLILVPADAQALDPWLTQQNITLPIVSMESPLQHANMQVFTDSEAMGTALAQALIDDGHTGSVLLVDPPGGYPGVTQRLQSASDVLTNNGLTVYICGDITQLPICIESFGASCLIAFDAYSTLLAADIAEQSQQNIAIYGVGTANPLIGRLEKGSIAAIAAWNDYAAGYIAVQGAIDAVQGKQVKRESPLSFSIVRKEDMYDQEHQEMLFPMDH